ncbi:uncharacterized protein LOC107473270 [Arachis duranensis]|uniref:Uncharacterized protein LOC107473270 n=1 Tax=Arachis duranensis TaxID=130453 RepID=A0A6P4CB42_ARADU|nr:uncharacterized protein LOC107473270 [Arachis duranensis]
MPLVEEIREAVLDCESSKTPGSDGYNMNFIKQCWEEISQKFTTAVMGFFQSAKIPTNANVTWVTLAPKFVGDNEIKDFRPISRKIHDGTLIACETVQWLKAHRKKAAIIKIDVQKAYDRVRWSFVDILLHKMGFGQRLRGWVKECVSTATMMLGEAIRNGRINPLLIGRDHIELSHLQFADDTILFCPPETETIEWVEHVCGLLECKQAVLPVKYFGISLGANPRLVKTWKPVIDKVEEKLNLWKVKVLNKAGKLVLIKSVLNSMPVYYLSLYKMPKAVADKLIALQRRFLWCKEDGNNGIPLMKWEMVQAPKRAGGLGVGDAVLRNTALLLSGGGGFSRKIVRYGRRLFVRVLQSETLSEEITSYSFTSSIWKGLVPPRIELFGVVTVDVIQNKTFLNYKEWTGIDPTGC